MSTPADHAATIRENEELEAALSAEMEWRKAAEARAER